MGIFTGEPKCRIDPITGRMDYFGPVVNRAARISGAGAGGQIVTGTNTYKRLQYVAGMEWTDLGVHRMKGLEEAERIYQVNSQGLAGRNSHFGYISTQKKVGDPLIEGPQQPLDIPQIARPMSKTIGSKSKQWQLLSRHVSLGGQSEGGESEG